jgi:putative salt-induced outer membrane protein YdiY
MGWKLVARWRAVMAAMGGAVALAVVLPTTVTQAQPPDAPAVHEEKAPALEKAPEEDETVWTINAGGVLNTGNTRSWMLTTGSRLRIVRGPHAFGAEALFNYGRADMPDDAEGYRDTARNLNARARYDFFFRPKDAVFAGTVLRWDRFAGLDPRAQAQAGYLRNLHKDEAHRVWVEVGYDFTFDRFYPRPVLDDMGMELDGTRTIHSARGFFGYDGRINDKVAFLTGLELLVSVIDPRVTRVNWENTLTTTLVGRLATELKFMLRFDNVPAPGREQTDTLTQLSLVYTLL